VRREPDMPDRHRRVVQALHSGGPAIPESLLRDVGELERTSAAEPRRPPRAGLRLGRPALAGGVAVAVAIALVLAFSVSSTGGPTVVQAAQLSALASERPAPAPDPERSGLLARSFAGVRYPDWSSTFEWRADGERSDEMDGRRTATVFYRHTHHRIGYTVISGATIEPPDDAERLEVNGLAMKRFRVGDQDVVTFQRNGRTCVLSGQVHDPDTLVKLAAWKAEGSTTS
jgi:hypothetical protein